MDFFGNMNMGSSNFNPDIARCPFLRNINEPTNLSFSNSMAFSMGIPVKDEKGPIFEDGPNFDMAFRLFHGQNGIVPLSEKSFFRSETSQSEVAPAQSNPLAAKAATISLSSFGGGFFGFDDFMKNNKKPKSSKKGGKSKHEAAGDEWLKTGNCPIAKSARAFSKALPLLSKAFKLPPGINYKCPPAIVAARAAIAKTAFAKNLRPQPLPNKVLAIGMLGMAVNIPLGIWREHTAKFSPAWFLAVHAAVPFIGMLRKSVLMPKMAMAFTIAASILGQVIGSRAERYRMQKRLESAGSSSGLPMEINDGGSIIGGRCGEIGDWNSNSLCAPVASSSTNVFG